jgi:O-antigen/teichoic acid export membrane protein
MLDPERNIQPNRPSLRHRALSAGGWLFIGYGLNLTLRFGSNLLMTRLLIPEMFGVISMASIVLVALAMFSDLGLKPCIVQSERGHDTAFLNTAWTIQVLQGILLWLAALAIGLLVWIMDQIGAFPVDSVYADPMLPFVIAALSFSALIGGLGSTKFHEASRGLRLGRVVAVVIASQVVGLVCMLAWVSVDRSIWALIAGGISSTAAQALLGQVWLPGPCNRWQWDRTAWREIVRFGKWIFLSSILGFLVNNGDRLLLGGMVNSSLLGLYAIAYLIFSAIEGVLGTIIGEIAFPALSEIVRERRAEVKAGYYRFQLVVASLSYASAGILIGAGQTIVGALYDRRYRPAGWMLEILAVGLVAVPWRSATLCFLALGRPQIQSYSTAARLGALALAVPIGYQVFAVAGAIWGIVLAQLAAVPMIAVHMAKEGLLDVRREFLLLLILPASALATKALVLATGADGAVDVMSALAPMIADLLHLRIHAQVQGN